MFREKKKATVSVYKTGDEKIESEKTQDENSKATQPVSYSQLLRFFLPLGVTPFMISSTHSLVNAALARLPLPELSIAVFTVVKSLTNAVKAPDLVTRQTTVSLVDGRRSYRLVMKFIWALCALLLGLLLVLSFTPAGEWVLRNLLGLTDQRHISLAYSALRITCFLPIVESLRNSMQGLAISLEETGIMPVGTTLRLGAVGLFLWWIVSTQAMPGIVAASLTWTIGIGLEAVLVAAYLYKRFGSPLKAAEKIPQRNERIPDLLDVIKFFAPLAVMMLMAAWIRPLIQSGLARSESPTQTLAAYGVAWGLVVLISGPVRMIHQISLIYTTGVDDRNWRRVKRFALLVGILVSGATLAVALSPAGEWLMADLIAVDAPVVRTALPVLAAFSLYPLLRAWRELHWGVLMCQKRTSMIGGAKMANILAVAVLLALFFFGPLQLGISISPAVAGALVYTVGEAMETFLIWRHAVTRCKVPERQRQGAPAMAAAD